MYLPYRISRKRTSYCCKQWINTDSSRLFGAVNVSNGLGQIPLQVSWSGWGLVLLRANKRSNRRSRQIRLWYPRTKLRVLWFDYSSIDISKCLWNCRLVSRRCYRLRMFVNALDLTHSSIFGVLTHKTKGSSVPGVKSSRPYRCSNSLCERSCSMLAEIQSYNVFDELETSHPIPHCNRYGLQTPQIREIMHLVSSFSINQASPKLIDRKATPDSTLDTPTTPTQVHKTT